jgi:hypothetical protein
MRIITGLLREYKFAGEHGAGFEFDHITTASTI